MAHFAVLLLMITTPAQKFMYTEWKEISAQPLCSPILLHESKILLIYAVMCLIVQMSVIA
jgi:hypothetical protein